MESPSPDRYTLDQMAREAEYSCEPSAEAERLAEEIQLFLLDRQNDMELSVDQTAGTMSKQMPAMGRQVGAFVLKEAKAFAGLFQECLKLSSWGTGSFLYKEIREASQEQVRES